MKRVKLRTKVIALSIFLMISIAAFGYSKPSLANQNVPVSDASIQLNVEKADKDKVKISLDNFENMAKSLQLSLKIEGDVEFNADKISWLVKSENENDIKTNIKLSSDKKRLDIFIVSNSNIIKDGGKMDLFEIEVIKNGSNLNYKIVPNINDDGIAYSYVASYTNRQEKGIDIINTSDESLSINSEPTISLIESPEIVEGNIIISQGSKFNAKSYVVATDEEDGNIIDITVEGNVDTSIVGSYKLKYTARDLAGDIATLETSVIVEPIIEAERERPVINGVIEKVTIKVGDRFNPLEGVTAKDYSGRGITVEVTGDYDVNVAGTYTLKYNAVDRLGNNADKKITTLIVEEVKEEKPEVPEVPEEKPEVPEEKPENPEVPEEKPEIPEENPEVPKNPNYTFEIPSNIESIIDEAIVEPRYGNGEKTSPLGLYVKEINNDKLNKLLSDFEKLSPIVESKTIGREYTTYKIKLTPKSNVKSSEEVYIELNIKNSSTELLTLVNSFAVKYGLSDDSNSGNLGDDESSNNNNNNNGNDSNNNGSGNENNKDDSSDNKGESLTTGDKGMLGIVIVLLLSGSVLGYYLFNKKKA